jgi:hypothetical protein
MKRLIYLLVAFALLLAAAGGIFWAWMDENSRYITYYWTKTAGSTRGICVAHEHGRFLFAFESEPLNGQPPAHFELENVPFKRIYSNPYPTSAVVSRSGAGGRSM